MFDKEKQIQAHLKQIQKRHKLAGTVVTQTWPPA